MHRSGVIQMPNEMDSAEKTKDLCRLPTIIGTITEQLVPHEMLKVDEMPEEYVGCGGYERAVSEGEWGPLLALYPGVIVLLAYCVIVPVFSMIWCIYHRLHTPHSGETRYRLMRRILFTWTLAFLTIPLVFFSWFIYKAYLARPKEKGDVIGASYSDVPENYKDYWNITREVLLKNINQMQDFITELPGEMSGYVVQYLPDYVKYTDKVGSQKLREFTSTVQPLVGTLHHDLWLVMSDITQLLDYSRYYARNIAEAMQQNEHNFTTYDEKLTHMMVTTAEKMRMLQGLDHAFIHINEIIDIMDEMRNMEQEASECVQQLYQLSAKYMGDTWSSAKSEIGNYGIRLLSILSYLHEKGSAEGVDLTLPKYMNILAMSFVVCAILVVGILVLVLIYSMFASINIKVNIFLRGLLTTLIWFICLSMVLLGMVCGLHFLFGAIIHNYKHTTIDQLNCARESSAYCDMRNGLIYFVESHTSEEKAEERLFTAKKVLDKILAHYSEHVLAKPTQSNRAFKLLSQIDLSVKASKLRTGQQFEMLQSAFEFNDLYETQDRITEWLEATPELKPLTRDVILCNLNTMKHSVFEQLLPTNISDRVNQLSLEAPNLSKYLPESFSTFMMKDMVNYREKEHFFQNRFKNMMRDSTEYVNKKYRAAMHRFLNPLANIPECESIKLLSRGITTESYKCLELTALGFFAGSLCILLLFLPILVISMCLLPLIERLYLTLALLSWQESRSTTRSDPSATALETQSNHSTPINGAIEPIEPILGDTQQTPSNEADIQTERRRSRRARRNSRVHYEDY